MSKSQLYHYFDDKADLIRAVVDHTKTVLLDLQQVFLDRLDDWAGIGAWFDAIVADETSRHARGGCPLGSLVPELADSDELAREVLARAFDEWQHHLTEGLRRLQARGELNGDPERLATATMASLQGGLLLSQVRRDPGQLRVALDAALAHLHQHRPRELAQWRRRLGASVDFREAAQAPRQCGAGRLNSRPPPRRLRVGRRPRRAGRRP